MSPILNERVEGSVDMLVWLLAPTKREIRRVQKNQPILGRNIYGLIKTEPLRLCLFYTTYRDICLSQIDHLHKMFQLFVEILEETYDATRLTGSLVFTANDATEE